MGPATLAAGSRRRKTQGPGLHPTPHERVTSSCRRRSTVIAMTATTPDEQLLAPLIGRDREVSALMDALDAITTQGSVTVLCGAAGLGRSALLGTVRAGAVRRRLHLLQTTSVPAESALPYAGLHCLLRPLLPRITELPAARRAVLEDAFGARVQDDPDPFLVALAALELLSARAAEEPLVVLADDLHLMDAASQAVVGFVGRRVVTDRIVVVATVAEAGDGHAAQLGLPLLHLRPLDAPAAAELLDLRAPDLPPLARRRILTEAAGSPRALLELASWPPTATAAASAFGRAALPLAPGLQPALPAPLTAPPTATVLLVAAAEPAASAAEVLTAATVLGGRDAGVDCLQPAIDAGVVRLDEAGIRFTSPISRLAVLQAAGVQDRRRAHRALADVLAGSARGLAHAARAAAAPDDELAARLAATARAAQARGALRAAAEGFAVAADASATSAQRVGHLLAAAGLAASLGLADQVDALCREAADLPHGRRDHARFAALRAAVTGGLDAETTHQVLHRAEQALGEGDVDLAVEGLHVALTHCWWSDAAPGVRCAVAALARRLPAHAAWASAQASAPDDHRVEDRPGTLAQSRAREALTAFEAGRLVEAGSAAAEAAELAEETGQDAWCAIAKAVDAALAGVRGDEDDAVSLAEASRALLARSPTARGHAWLHLALGLTALTADRKAEAYRELAQIFDPAQPACHSGVQRIALTYLAEAAVTHAQQEETRRHLLRLAATAPDDSAPRHARAFLATGEDALGAFSVSLEHAAPASPFDLGRLLLAHGTLLRRRRHLVEARQALRGAHGAFAALGAPAWVARTATQLDLAGGGPFVMAPPEASSTLSPDELAIARLAARGLSNRQIGDELRLSHRTVAGRLSRTFPKLGVTSRRQLSAVMLDEQWPRVAVG